jgi:hypothetical protein
LRPALLPDLQRNAIYENHGISARVSVTSAEGFAVTGPGGQNGIYRAELFSDDYTQYDFSSSFDLGELFGRTWGAADSRWTSST